MAKENPARKKDVSDLTDAPWAIVESMIPHAKPRTRGGRPRTVDMREVLNTMCSLNRSGGPWEMLPHDVLPKRTVYDAFAQWRDDGPGAKLVKALRAQTRVEAGREPTPRAACIDSPAVKTAARGGPERSDEGGKHIKGRQRPVLVDTLGLVRAMLLTSAGLDDGVAAPHLLGQREPGDFPRLRTLFVDQKDHHHALDAWMAAPRAGWRREVKTRPEGTKGCTPLENRWVIERTHAWPGRYRRNSKDDERSGESSTAMRQMSNMHFMLKRLEPCRYHVFHYRKDAA